MHIQVDTFLGHGGMQMPARFHFDGRHIDVVEILYQWHGPDYRYIKVKGDDGGLYILRVDDSRADWELTMFESPRAQILATM
jgi:hypothetical protein